MLAITCARACSSVSLVRREESSACAAWLGLGLGSGLRLGLGLPLNPKPNLNPNPDPDPNPNAACSSWWMALSRSLCWRALSSKARRRSKEIEPWRSRSLSMSSFGVGAAGPWRTELTELTWLGLGIGIGIGLGLGLGLGLRLGLGLGSGSGLG